jgi:hypothetical protein
MNNSDNNKVKNTTNSGWLADFIEECIRYFRILFYAGAVFWPSFGIMHIFFDEFAATLLAVLVVYIRYDCVVRDKMMSS